MTKPDLENISRDELIEQALAAHHRAETESHRAEAERARRVETGRQLDWFKKQLFGAKSERRLPFDADPSQLSLGEVSEARDEGKAEATSVAGHRRRAPRKAKTDEDKGLRFDESVPVDTIRLEPDELCGAHADEYEVISEKETFRLAQQPASYRVLRYVRPVLKRKATGEIVSPLAPASVLPGSYADVSLLAGMLVDKFRSHLPLYRQHQRLHAAGITVSRTSLTNWVHQAIELLEPIYDAQLASILTSSVLAMDETPVRAGRKGKGKMRTGYFWPVFGDQQEVAFPFAPSRAKKYVEEILGEYAGTLLTDGYTAYERYAEQRDAVVHAQCWVHARRGFVKAEGG